mmetsp:Transcript_77647/g.142099  ORF Transcript_77647/g.142099 Transcript_77647/m.142099 type:complete len:867 (+) Transcript_77647:85-2685(+)
MPHVRGMVPLCVLSIVIPILSERVVLSNTDYTSALQSQVHVERQHVSTDESKQKGHAQNAQVLKKKHETEVPKSRTATGLAPAPATPDVGNAADDANEQDLPRPFWQNLLIFFGMATLIFVVMLFLVGLLQFAVRAKKELEEEIMARIEGERRTKSSRNVKIPSEKPPMSPRNIDDNELALLLNGDHVRFGLLLSLATAKTPKTAANDFIAKGAKANKLKLSDRSVSQASNGLLAVAEAAFRLNKTRDASLSAKKRLQKAFQDVRTTVRVTKAMKPNKDTHEVNAWTDNAGHENHQADKYSDGHAGGMGGHKSTALGTLGAVEAYFASEKWLDHFAILFITSYGQVCALLYAMYLKNSFPKMYSFMGPWLLVSRGEAMALIIYTVFMVLLMSRRFITLLRDYVHWSSVLQLVVDKHVLMHRCCGMMIVVSAVLHVIGHLRGSIPAIINEPDNKVINRAFTYGTKIKFNFNSWPEALRCYPAITGFVLIFLLSLFWLTSNEKARRWNFELFHYMHLLLIVLWTVGLSVHGARQWLGLGVPLGLLAVAPVVTYYVIERGSDIYRGISPTIKISNAVIKKRTVLLEIDTGSSGFKYETGMYCMLKAPEVSNYQWHPFTIASAGGERYFQVLFAIVGDWTTQLKDMIADSQKNKKPYPEICVRGGYGAPAEAMKEKKHIVMVGAGVGATPFLSFLSNICSAAKAGRPSQFDGLRTAVFYWVSREPEDFVWVNQYNTVIDATPALKDRVAVRLCLSKTLDTSATDDCSAAEVALFWVGVQIALRKFSAFDLSKELAAPTQFGRPNWETEFTKCAEEALRSYVKGGKQAEVEGTTEISIFACGNKMLVASLEEACDALTDDEMAFRLYAEEF